MKHVGARWRWKETSALKMRKLFSAQKSRVLMLVCVFSIAVALPSALIAEEQLTNAAQVLSLSAERAAQRIPIRVKGIVTAAEPTWGGKFFVQDDTSGV